MSSNPEAIDGIVTLRPQPESPVPLPVQTEQLEAPESLPAQVRSRPGWAGSAAVGVVGIIATGVLGGFLWSTTGQRDVARHQMADTQATLGSTQHQLSAAQTDAAARRVTASYVSLYIADSGRLHIDYQSLGACSKYSECRSAAQQLLSDLQAFQSDRASVTVPAALASSDAMLGDGLSAAIAAVQLLITGMDDGDRTKIKDGWNKLDAALLTIAKAETALGNGLK